MPANDAENLGDRLPSRAERDAAKQLGQALAACVDPDSKHGLTVGRSASDSTGVVLTPALLRLLTDLLGHIGSGDCVHLSPVPRKLTKQQAADVLNVPLPYLLILLKAGAITCDSTDRQRRVTAESLFEFKRSRDAQRASALDKLAAFC